MVCKKDTISRAIHGIIIFVTGFAICIPAFAQQKNRIEGAEADSVKQGNSPVIMDNSTDNRDTGPGPVIDEQYSKEQDSAYLKAMDLRIPTERRLINDFKLYMGYFRVETSKEETIWDAYERAFRISRTVYLPLSTEVVQRYEQLQRSMQVDGVNTLPKIGTGAQISLEAIGKFLGIVEDVSPYISYELTQRAEVEILIYSIQAKLVRVIYKTTMLPGKHELTWNGRDDSGMKVPRGDYIAEIRIGSDRLKTKRIRID